ncbi:MAG TPA: thioredoxin family protein [Gemmatimonadales bacterium]|nr:thioredoxin family protein [Gemmatimonadales bacterium]
MTTLEAPAGPRIVSYAAWVEERKALLAEEKELTRRRDELARRRRELPWVKIEKEYWFDGPNGRESLGDLFAGRSQLIVYHFMFAPGWEEGCPACSLMGDHIDGSVPHLAARDVTLLAVSRAPLAELAPFRQRMGWRFKWVSSSGSDFNYDRAVAVTPEMIGSGTATYNFRPIPPDAPTTLLDLPGVSVFYRNEEGEIFLTYSVYARGLEPMLGVYNWLDLVPDGRDEEGLPFPMVWLRHHDRYDPGCEVDPDEGYPVAAGRKGCCE